jgi:hypothetical protein
MVVERRCDPSRTKNTSDCCRAQWPLHTPHFFVFTHMQLPIYVSNSWRVIASYTVANVRIAEGRLYKSLNFFLRGR